jgi:hypothetical protein
MISGRPDLLDALRRRDRVVDVGAELAPAKAGEPLSQGICWGVLRLVVSSGAEGVFLFIDLPHEVGGFFVARLGSGFEHPAPAGELFDHALAHGAAGGGEFIERDFECGGDVLVGVCADGLIEDFVGPFDELIIVGWRHGAALLLDVEQSALLLRAS